jgi:hypothetical protein
VKYKGIHPLILNPSLDKLALGSKRDYTPKEVAYLSSFDSINPIVKVLVIRFFHWRYKIIALGKQIFGLLKGFLLEVDLSN